ncbi:MAG TPA: hypothetical protein VFM55_16450 [Micromonosporaceae bacterium]|nr:hypothetical protein [Micromonosporaceae bacterium]
MSQTSTRSHLRPPARPAATRFAARLSAARLSAAALPAAGAGLALLAVGPLLAPGYVLAYDMVFTPQQPLSPAGIGLGPALPRAVPVDAVVSLATLLVDGAVLQKLVLVGIFVGAFLGAAAVCPVDRRLARAAAGVLYAWNPYVAERLFMGHWSLLAGYACLPWVLAGALRVRRGAPGGWPRLLVPMAVAAITPTGGLLALLVALAPVASAGARRLALLAAAGAALNAPWWVPGALHPGAGGTDPAGVAAFAARAENWSGVAGAVLTFGGFWNREVMPASRATVLATLLGALVLAGAAAGVAGLARAWGGRLAAAMAVLAALSLILSLAAALPGGAGLLRWAVAELTGAGLLRDAQKWLAPWVLACALAFGSGVARIAGGLRRRGVDRGVVAAFGLLAVVLPVAVVPDLALGGAGRLRPVAYPADWAAVRHILATGPEHGAVAVLPFTPYRDFPWNGGRIVLDPAPRYLPGEVVLGDRLWVADQPLAGEDPRAATVAAELDRGAAADLGAVGVGWVAVQHGVGGPLPEGLLGGLVPVHNGTHLSLYRVPGQVTRLDAPAPAVAPVLVADLAALLVLAGALLAIARRASSSSSRPPEIAGGSNEAAERTGC